MASTGWAHTPFLRGHLIDLVAGAERIVIATVETSQRRPVGDARLNVRVDSVLAGQKEPQQVELISRNYLPPGGRFVFFLRRLPDHMESLAPAGTVFAAVPADDRDYRRTILAIQEALKRPEEDRRAALCGPLIEALTAKATALRYEAAMELDGLVRAGHRPTKTETETLRGILHSEKTDPTLRSFLKTFVGDSPPEH